MTLLGEGEAGLSSFISNKVGIHSVLTDRIDQLRPSQQLTLKAGLGYLSGFMVLRA